MITNNVMRIETQANKIIDDITLIFLVESALEKRTEVMYLIMSVFKIEFNCFKSRLFALQW